MNPRILFPVGTLALASASLPLHAAQYGPQVFNQPNGTTDLGDGTTIASNDNSAAVEGGALILTRDGTTNTHASLRIPALAASAQGWTASFEFTLADQPGNTPGEGFSFSYGAIPAFNNSQGSPAAADAHGAGEEGWGAATTHLAFEFDTRDNGVAERGFNISRNGVDLAFENRMILTDGQTLGGSVWLSWHPSNGASMSVDLGEGLSPVFTNVATPGFAGNNNHVFALGARTGSATQHFEIDNLQVTTTPPGFIVLPTPVISEFMAENGSTLEDEDCRNTDWLELFNSTANSINLEGWYLTDDPDEPAKWRIPDLPLDANARTVIFASNQDRTEGELHTDFRLDKNGGYLALVKPDGVTVASSFLYPPQIEDISYGTLGPGQSTGSFRNPTPGDPNIAPQGSFLLEKVIFSQDSQVITGQLNLELSSPLPGTTIRYTTNHDPNNPSWRTYTGPISIRDTTRVTARLEQAGKEPGPLRDRTFIKLGTSMQSVRSNLPLVIIDSFRRNIDGESSSNSQNPKRPVHGIFIDVDPASGLASPTDPPDFEGRGGMRVRGQTSSGFAKKQYSFETWTSEGNDKNVSIFGFPEESDWVIHAPYSDKSLMRNKIVYETSLEMGYPASRTLFCELYFNTNGGDVSTADYRGVYVFMEKIKRSDGRVNIKKLENCDNDNPKVNGGYIFKKDKGQSVDVTFNTKREGHNLAFVEPDQPTGDQRAWLDSHVDRFEDTLWGSRFDHPTRGYRSFIDVQSFIDTHIWVEVYKNIDGYRLSSYFYKDRGRKIVASPVWDYNLSLGNADYLGGEYPNGWYYTQLNSSAYPWYNRLFLDPEFNLQYWDRWFELREGIFDTGAMMARIDNHTSMLNAPARRNFQKWRILGNHLWPNARSWTPPAPLPGSDRNLAGARNRRTFGDEVDWMKGWLTARLAWIDDQSDNPPVFSRNGGIIPGGTRLTITNPNSGGGQIFYTTDGSDPRLPGNQSITTLLPAESQCRYIIPDSEIAGWNTVEGPANLASWNTGRAGLGYETSPGPYAPLINTSLPPGTTSTYARFEFEMAAQSTLDALGALNLRMQYDDGFAAYLNGVKVASANAPDSPDWNSVATGIREGEGATSIHTISLSSFKDELRVGTNVLAIQSLNSGVTSTGLLCNLEILASSTDDAPSASALLYSQPLTLNGSQTVRARVKTSSGWSPIQTEAYLLNGTPAGPANLAVSELNYRPSPGDSEARRGFDERIDFEYVEVMNISDQAVDLSGVAFTDGIDFKFDLGEIRYLAPGERVVVVSNRDAFSLRYARLASGLRIAGEYNQNLSNDGENITLSAADGSAIRSFTYNDRDPWPELADGDGLSLVLRNPLSNPDHSDPLNWRSSAVVNGAPGGSDGSEFIDRDADGASDFLEYATAPSGTPPRLPSMTIRSFDLGGGGGSGEFMTFSYTRNRLADDVRYTVQQSPNLSDWSPGTEETMELIERIENPDGTDTISFRLKREVRDAEELYLRLAVEKD
ncbi:MAG: CotH kinase family protein [Roseibacillus sp.]|nr:CotH kinase family protein [Roseibacillus sp.]